MNVELTELQKSCPLQNHRTTEVGRDFWRSSGQAMFTQGHLEAFDQDHVQKSLEYFQGWRLHNLSGQPVMVFSHSHNKKVFTHTQMEPPVFQFVSIYSGAVTGHHCQEPDTIFFIPSQQVFIHMLRSFLRLLFSSISSPSSLNLSSYERHSSSLTISVVLRWTLCSSSMPLLYQGAQNWTQ